MVVDLKPDQKWEVAHDRVMAQDLLSRSERKAGNLKKALWDWDAGHNAEGCDSGVAVKREGSHHARACTSKSCLKRLRVNLSKTPQKFNEARPAEVLCKNKFRRLQRKV